MHWMDLLTYCVMAWMSFRAFRGNVERIVTVNVMIMAWWFGEVYAHFSGNVLPVEFYWIPDAAVICAIVGYQAKTTRAIIAIYALTMWPIYAAASYGELTRRDTWIALWGLNLAQFILAGMSGERARDGVAGLFDFGRPLGRGQYDSAPLDLHSSGETFPSRERFSNGALAKTDWTDR